MKYEEDKIEFWDDIYVNGNTGWDLRGITPVFAALAEEIKPGKVCILGCGRGYDAVMFAEKGFKATAVDFSREPLKFLKRLAKNASVEVEILQEDMFSMSPDFDSTFDYVIEQTCFCAINPERRSEYEVLVKSILKPGGQLIGLWFPLDKGIKEGGPPYATPVDEVKTIFSSNWKIVREEFSIHTIPPRIKREKLIIFEKIKEKS